GRGTAGLLPQPRLRRGEEGDAARLSALERVEEPAHGPGVGADGRLRFTIELVGPFHQGSNELVPAGAEVPPAGVLPSVDVEIERGHRDAVRTPFRQAPQEGPIELGHAQDLLPRSGQVMMRRSTRSLGGPSGAPSRRASMSARTARSISLLATSTCSTRSG